MPDGGAISLPLMLAIGAGAGGGLGALGGMFGQKNRNKVEDKWRESAFPLAGAVNAQATQNRGQLGQARLGSYQNLFTNLAARGFGSGSGLGAAGGQGIERGYLQGLGNMMTELTKFKNTPMFGPPSSMYEFTDPLQGMVGSLNGMLNQGMGFAMMSQMMGGGGGGMMGGAKMKNPYTGGY